MDGEATDPPWTSVPVRARSMTLSVHNANRANAACLRTCNELSQFAVSLNGSVSMKVECRADRELPSTSLCRAAGVCTRVAEPVHIFILDSAVLSLRTRKQGADREDARAWLSRRRLTSSTALKQSRIVARILLLAWTFRHTGNPRQSSKPVKLTTDLCTSPARRVQENPVDKSRIYSITLRSVGRLAYIEMTPVPFDDLAST